VIVDRFKVLSFDSIPDNPGIGIGASRNIADQVFHENRVRISMLRYCFLVRPLEQTIEFRAGREFDHPEQIFNPDRLGEPDTESDFTALVVRSALADCLGAGTKGGHRHNYGHQEIKVIMVGGGRKSDGVIHQPKSSGDGSSFLNEVREFNVDMRLLRVQPTLQMPKNNFDIFDLDD
jgi:hypothetical protein